MSRQNITRDQARAAERSPDQVPKPDLDIHAMSVKQLAQTVRYGRLVTFLVFDGEPIKGYLGGMDAHYFYVLSPEKDGFRRWIISRAGNPAFELHERATYDTEPQKEQMEQIIAPFRGWVSNKILNRSGSDATTRKAG